MKKAKPSKKKKQLRVSAKQQRLLVLISENVGKDKPMTLEQMMLKAGYSQSVAKQQSTILNTAVVSDGMEDIKKKFENVRDRAFKAITEQKLKAEGAKNLVDLIDKVQKNVNLLGGGDTERVAHRIDGIEMIDPTKNE